MIFEKNDYFVKIVTSKYLVSVAFIFEIPYLADNQAPL